MKNSKVEFKLDQTNLAKDERWTFKYGPIFEAGDYPDKKFSLSPEELLDAVNKFRPVPIDVEHKSTPFDGKLGTLEHVEVGSDGYSIFGTVKVPTWLANDVYEGNPMKVSCTWTRGADKRIEKLAIVNKPRISQAAMFAAFSKSGLDEDFEKVETSAESVEIFAEDKKDKTWDGQGTMQQMHDIACRAGAICDPSNSKKSKKAKFVSESESASIQSIHDVAVKGGAECRFMEEDSERPYYFNEDKETRGKKIMKNLDDILAKFKQEVEAGIGSGNAAPEDTSKFSDELAALKAELAALKEEKATPKAEEKTAEMSAKEQETETETSKLLAEIESLKKEKIAVTANTFAESVIADKKAVPANKAAIAALFTQLSLDDSKSEDKVTFSNDGKEVEGSRVEAFKALFASAKPHNLTVEELVDAALVETEFSADDKEAEAIEQARAFAAAQNKNKK